MANVTPAPAQGRADRAGAAFEPEPSASRSSRSRIGAALRAAARVEPERFAAAERVRHHGPDGPRPGVWFARPITRARRVDFGRQGITRVAADELEWDAAQGAERREPHVGAERSGKRTWTTSPQPLTGTHPGPGTASADRSSEHPARSPPAGGRAARAKRSFQWSL